MLYHKKMIDADKLNLHNGSCDGFPTASSVYLSKALQYLGSEPIKMSICAPFLYDCLLGFQ